MSIEVEAIAHVRGGRVENVDDHWGDVEAELVLADGIPDEALDGIEAFSHLEVIYFMHAVPPAKVEHGARHPRNLAHLPRIGILAQRPKARPNRLGLSRCELIARDGRRLRVRGLDAIDGTPVIDIKPWFTAFGPRGAVREPAWIDEIVRAYY